MTHDEQYYFAYGSNMDPRHMASLCPGTMALGRALLADHRFLINRHGYAAITPARQEVVHGVLWTINSAHEAALDQYEAVLKKLYHKARRRLLLEDGASVDALIYLAEDTEAGSPAMDYLEGILFGAQFFRLPPPYRAELESWKPDAPPAG